MSGDALYRLVGGRYLPGERAGSPWSRGAQHGGPPCGLLAHALERAAAGSGLVPVRLTVDLYRAVPSVPLGVEVSDLRLGRRIAVRAAVLRDAEGRDVARATGVFLRPSEAAAFPPAETLPPPDEQAPTEPMAPRAWRDRMPPGFHFEVRVRWQEGAAGRVAWIEMPMALIEDVPLSPFVRAATLADFGNAVSSRARAHATGGLPRAFEPGFINTDVSLHLQRLPGDGAIGFVTESIGDQGGVGGSVVKLFDAAGRFATVVQSRLANERTPGSRGEG